MEEISKARLLACEACPRLLARRLSMRASHPDYHAAPVAPWGSKRARLLIVGLAPGLHGANRTGRPFTGDASGRFLFAALERAGFATSACAASAKLVNARITNAVRCLPPDNRPLAGEIRNCNGYLAAELATLRARRPRHPRVILCLGRIAHDAVAKALPEPIPPFAHGQLTRVAHNVYVVDAYHPSRQNTQTGRLTVAMLDGVFDRIRRLLSVP